MKSKLKSIVLIHLSFLFETQSYPIFYTKFINATEKNIQVNMSYITYNYDGIKVFQTYKIKDIERNKWFYLKENEHFYLEKKYKIEVKELATPCSWVHIFNQVEVVHGVGLEIFIDSESKGIICANKRNVIDYCYNAILSYTYTKDNKILHFYNVGWWQNASVYPTSLEIILESNH